MKVISKALAAAALAGTVSGCVSSVSYPQNNSDRFAGCALGALNEVTGEGRGHAIGPDEVRNNNITVIRNNNGAIVATGGAAGQNEAVVARTGACLATAPRM